MRQLFAVGVLLLSCAAASAFKVAPAPSIPVRAASAEAVIVGTVSSIEDKTIKASPYPGATEKVEFTIAVVKIEQNLHGAAKGVTHIKVGLAPGGRRGVTLTKGEEVCLFLHKHPDEGFYTVRDFNNKINPKGPQFKTELDEIKKTTEVLARPMDALKAKDANERYRAAALLIQHYRPRETELSKTKPIDAEESKLILLALAEADWNAFKGDWMLSPQGVFGQLQLTEKDGWKIKQGENFEAAAKKWLKDNAEKYRIQRVVKGDEK